MIRHRNDVNRGMGYSSYFFARRTKLAAERPLSDDLERQDLLVVTREQMLQHLFSGAFGEVRKFYALALLKL